MLPLECAEHGGVIVSREIRTMHRAGVATKRYSADYSCGCNTVIEEGA